MQWWNIVRRSVDMTSRPLGKGYVTISVHVCAHKRDFNPKSLAAAPTNSEHLQRLRNDIETQVLEEVV